MSKYVICVGKEYAPGKNKFTEVGVGFDTRNGEFGIRLHFDLKLLVEPEDNLFVFLRKEKAEE